MLLTSCEQAGHHPDDESSRFQSVLLLANNFAAKICPLLSQIRVHINIIIKITSIKYITLTTLSFFIFSNVLPHDITKNPVKFCFSLQMLLRNMHGWQ